MFHHPFNNSSVIIRIIMYNNSGIKISRYVRYGLLNGTRQFAKCDRHRINLADLVFKYLNREFQRFFSYDDPSVVALSRSILACRIASQVKIAERARSRLIADSRAHPARSCVGVATSRSTPRRLGRIRTAAGGCETPRAAVSQ